MEQYCLQTLVGFIVPFDMPIQSFYIIMQPFIYIRIWLTL